MVSSMHRGIQTRTRWSSLAVLLRKSIRSSPGKYKYDQQTTKHASAKFINTYIRSAPGARRASDPRAHLDNNHFQVLRRRQLPEATLGARSAATPNAAPSLRLVRL